MQNNIKFNKSLIMDFYELTMANSYFITNKGLNRTAFDVFYRNNPDEAAYSIYAGLDEIVDYILNFHFEKEDIEYLRSLKIFDEKFLEYLSNFKFKGDIYSLKEGSIIYPNEPIITVIGTLIECQIIETGLLVILNHQSLIATKANRIYLASKGRAISDFGARRAHGYSAALYGARAAYIGGVSSTATVLAGEKFGIPVSGTMAHSFVMSYESEYEAFLDYAKCYPQNSVFLIDTYNVIDGVNNAIKVAKDYLRPNNYPFKGVRIDSGDLAYLTKKVRKILDDNGFNDTKIVVSNALDEYKIVSLLEQGAKIDSFGVGENLITSKSSPVFGGVYKMCALFNGKTFEPKIKLSETVEKITNPAIKDLYRVYTSENKAIADLIAIKGEKIDLDSDYFIVDPDKPWKEINFKGYRLEKLQIQIFKDGKLIYNLPKLDEIQKFVRKQVDKELWDEEKRFILPHIHYVDYTKNYYELKQSLIEAHHHEK